MYRTQPLYDSGSPACMEPTIILAQLAEEDGVFDHGISIASVMETADPEYFKNVDEFLPIPIKAEAKDRFVLRAIELASSSGREGAKRLSVGHSIASSQIVKSYLSRRNIVNIQGLVQRGKESKNHIMLHGLCRVKAITDTPSSLHAVGIAGVESMPIIQQLVCKYNQAKVALSDASAQGLPAHEYQALKVVQHLETAHGFPTITSNMTKYCTWHDKWTFGHEQTNGHFEMHIDALLRGYAEQGWCRRTCWFCLVDKGLPAAMRAHCFKEPHKLVAHVCRVHIYPDCSPVCHCPFCNTQILTYDFTDHLREHDLVLGAKALLRRPDLVGQASKACKRRDDWISWVQSITPLPPPPAAMSSIQSAAQEEINASMAQVVADAKEQVAGQVDHSVLPISSTGATQETSPANLSCPVLSAGCHGCCGAPLVVRHACPFCTQDESLPAEQRSQVWDKAKFAQHVAGVHLFNMSSSPTTCPSCGEAMPIKELALHLDR
ncbi:uncharacterized protein UHOD_12009 [Ustilago sp. UG-2017b]|nr:uncharacterized protein UHOD_12009 [Ustilago sp. UG-2017b]